MNAKEIIRFFGMKPLSCEGGYYVETYRAKEKISQLNLTKEYEEQRCYSTAILYLITPESYSGLHRLKSDEVFHFYLGDAVTMLQLHPEGRSEIITLGQDVLRGERVQTVVPRGSWQGCMLKKGGKFALMGCTTAPGFEFEDYEQGDRETLLQGYPTQRKLILKLTNNQ